MIAVDFGDEPADVEAFGERYDLPFPVAIEDQDRAKKMFGILGCPSTVLIDRKGRIVGRGAGDPDANSNISKLTHRLRDEMGFGWAEVAFSGVAQPRVDAVLRHSARLGFRRIIVFPYFLLTGVLVKQIYAQADVATRLFPEIEFVKALYLRDHPEVLGAFHDRFRELCDRDPAGPLGR